MNDVVIDSSVVAKWFVRESDSADAQRVMADTQTAGKRLIVLDLVFVEVANVVWKKHRQKLITLTEANGILADLMKSPLHAEPAARHLDKAFEIAVKYDRAVYDALFVALTQDLGIKGVTADEPLYNATHADFPQVILLRDWP
jgi:predicted nucleic acid-binding protein